MRPTASRCLSRRSAISQEQLWPHLEELADQLVQHLAQPGQGLDWIHAHYADAGFVGALVSQIPPFTPFG